MSVTRRQVLTRTAAGVTGLAGAGVLAGCDAGAGAPKQRGPAKIAFWVYGGGGPIGDVIFKQTAAEYQQKFPETTIEYASLPSAEIQEKMLVSWMSDTTPDIVMDS